MFNSSNLNKGFSLSEMMVVVFIISLVFVAALPTITKRQMASQMDSIPSGTIILWYGLIDDDNHPPPGYKVCNTTSASQIDLSGKFIVGANSDSSSVYQVGTTGGGASYHLSDANFMPQHYHSMNGITASSAGSHTHTLDSCGDDAGHYHAYTSGDVSATHTQDVWGYTAAMAYYRPCIFDSTLHTGGLVPAGTNPAYGSATDVFKISPTSLDDATNSHFHSITVNSNGAHAHTCTPNNVTHTHTITLGDTGLNSSFNTLPPYRALYYLVKE